MPLWFEIVVVALLVVIAIIVIVAAVTHEAPDTSEIASALTSAINRQSSDLAMIFKHQRDMAEERAIARFQIQRHEEDMIRARLASGFRLNSDPATKTLSDVDVKKILSEARLTFVENGPNKAEGARG